MYWTLEALYCTIQLQPTAPAVAVRLLRLLVAQHPFTLNGSTGWSAGVHES